ncbi:MAG: isopeptide-forming domain-containing fimbrial protein [Firmicutes bacterium]|nr:isopeptide-forming domain-containing fimbrial protein [Bacillota bacterium]
MISRDVTVQSPNPLWSKQHTPFEGKNPSPRRDDNKKGQKTMKKMSKIFALLVAIVMVVGMSVSAFAASISVEQDPGYAGTAGEAGRTYTYKEIFHATLAAANTSTGGGYDTDGTPGTVTDSLAKGYSYYLNSTETTQISELGTWDATTKKWTKAAGNLWFDLTPSADGSQYVVSWAEGVATDTDTAQAAAKWLSTNYTAVASGSLTWDSTNKKWTATGLEDGYYLLISDTGNNLVAATGDITIKEKNTYPPIDKTQADEDNTAQVDASKNVAVGDILTYQAKVTIPATAKVGDVMTVVDTPSKGLTYNGDVAVKENTGNATVAFGTAATGQAWKATITVTESSKGKDVIFEYTMTVNADAIVDTDRINTFELKYGDNYTAIPETVPYTTYFTGIEKVDGDDKTIKLEGVEFTLKEGTTEFKVKKNTEGIYIPDATGSAIVVTDANGLIKIRGLDSDKTYTLTETKTKPGYNLLPEPKTLTLIEDKGDVFTTATFDQIENNKGVVLPSTGGVGTTIFYIVGAILMIGAGVVLVTRRRMSAQ